MTQIVTSCNIEFANHGCAVMVTGYTSKGQLFSARKTFTHTVMALDFVAEVCEGGHIFKEQENEKGEYYYA